MQGKMHEGIDIRYSDGGLVRKHPYQFHMKLSQVQIKDYRSIDDSTPFKIDPQVTAFVGLNESGKTSILQAIHKSLAGAPDVKFALEADFPRKRLAEHTRKKPTPSVRVCSLTFDLNAEEVATLEAEFGKGLMDKPGFVLGSYFDGGFTWEIPLNQKVAIAKIAEEAKAVAGLAEIVTSATNVREVITKLRAATLDQAGTAIRDRIVTKFEPDKHGDELLWRAVVNRLTTWLPKTFYFDDYLSLPGKVNLADLQARKNANNPDEPHKTILALLDVAGVTVEDLTTPAGFENARARLESISAGISDRVFKFWKQNDQIDVEFHVSDDGRDSPPFNNGKNLYVRIRNNKHRVTMSLGNRSKGFIWFFSFLIWFDKMKAAGGSAPILLLDEPGLSLHALAQRDLLTYIDHLSEQNQVLYTTHSPFMVETAKLNRVRVVEDKPQGGTQVSSNVSSSNKNTLFPLQAALGYTIAQSLFIQTRNLLVEGPSDLVLLQFVTAALEANGRRGLRHDIAIVPVGGAGKIATFVSLLNAQDLMLVSLTDKAGGGDDQQIMDLVKQKIFKEKFVLNYSQFRPGDVGVATDVEDLIPIADYLAAFNKTFVKQLTVPIAEKDMPPGSRVIDRLERYLAAKGITLRPSGGFNHYAVIESLVSDGAYKPDSPTLDLFEKMFAKINPLFDEKA